ncbi:tRNA-uridine aminocarboxypropyltransferase [Alteromonas sp. 1_MG-2023]|uniref:tRNA-uridine aminocarboxypropyltransferase n=1 Tax=Alteromonas sp. 1_MG-2023 TaxID=3062669 RepID=UPI0026E20C66|nr:tRNA-uridine aminocarboxypropyltransferase [Alteromonas sp. 1_MG-2023]MDO6566775.1 tRNA-uridine aminocarboxypropyltransferase [Alteromonas sp. 1_MG-2023]
MRAKCNTCGYPEKTCICCDITTVMIPIKVFVIQHVKEASNAKNTARLLKLCSDDIDIVTIDNIDAMEALSQSCHCDSTALLYPSTNSISLESQHEKIASSLQNLLVIDGSWKQAYAILQQFPWLQSMPSFHFEHAPSSQYRIRHTRVSEGLSTLEATAYTLSTLYNINTEPYIKLQNAMQDNWRGPKAHQRSI